MNEAGDFDAGDQQESTHKIGQVHPRGVSAADRKIWVRFASSGMEIAGYTIALGWAGWFVDRAVGNQRPLVSALGGAIGFSFGMYRLIRMALAAQAEFEKERAELGKKRAEPEKETRET